MTYIIVHPITAPKTMEYPKIPQIITKQKQKTQMTIQKQNIHPFTWANKTVVRKNNRCFSLFLARYVVIMARILAWFLTIKYIRLYVNRLDGWQLAVPDCQPATVPDTLIFLMFFFRQMPKLGMRGLGKIGHRRFQLLQNHTKVPEKKI